MLNKSPLMMLLVVTAVFLSGCAMAVSPATGVWYTDVKAPVAATESSGSSKVGMGSVTSILGLVATGDASIATAAKSAGITKVHHVDYETMSILGIYAKYTVKVYGE